MNIREEILKEHSKDNSARIAKYACRSEENFRELMSCFVDDDEILSQRAAWSVGLSVDINPDLILPYTSQLIAALEKKHVHDAVKRNAARVLQYMEIPEENEGAAMNTCFGLLQNPSTAVAIKVFCMSILFNLSGRWPEIKPELKLVIEENWNHETAAFRARAKKILLKLEK